MAGTCGYGEGLSGSINAGNFLTSCKVYWLASQEGLLHVVSKYSCILTVSVAARSKAYVCGRSPAEILSSNPAEGMDICLL